MKDPVDFWFNLALVVFCSCVCVYCAMTQNTFGFFINLIIGLWSFFDMLRTMDNK